MIEVRKLRSKPRDRAKVDLLAPVEFFAEGPAQASASAPSADQAAANRKPFNLPLPLNPAPLKQSPQNGAVNGNEKQAAASSKPLDIGEIPTPLYPTKLRIVLDAGHGGWDLGTVGRKGLLEKDLTLDIVERLGQLVESRLGAEVIYTRKDDNYLALEKRAEIANLAQASLFVSVHANYSDYPSARGVETYYTNTYSSVKARTDDVDEAATPGLKSVDWTNVDIRAKVHESRRVAASVTLVVCDVIREESWPSQSRGQGSSLCGADRDFDASDPGGGFVRQQSHRREQFAEFNLPAADCRGPLQRDCALSGFESAGEGG